MNVTSKITVDMTRNTVGSLVNAVQGDGNARSVEITLLSGGTPWTPPGGVEAAIAYKQPGGTKGLYNKLADGTAAISISGNVATVILATQMLAVSGTVQASLVFNDQQLNRLTTFPFSVSVASNPAAGAQKVEDYIRLQWLEDKLDEYVKKITEGLTPGGSGGAVSSVNGKTGAVELTAEDVHALPGDTVIPPVDATLANEGEAADAKATGDALNQLKNDLAVVNNTTENPVGAGKVWTAMESGAGWFEPPAVGGASKSERLIQSYTTEVVGNQVISQDMDGNPFFLRSVNIHMYVPASESASGIITLLSGAKYAAFGYITQMANTSDRVVKFHAEASMTGVFASWYLTGKPGYPSANTQAYTGIDRDMAILDGIDKITIGCNVLPVGTTIVISGVDV